MLDPPLKFISDEVNYIYHILQYTEENCELHSIIVKHQTYEKVVIATRWRIQDFSDGRGHQPQR